jgi:putative ABC transport system ATP-binding protein
MIELRDLTKVYREGDRDRVVFRDVTCRIDAGEVVVLMGPSGTGKSTLLNLVSGIDLPTSGDVRVNGTSTTALSERDRTLFRRHHIGFVFQFFNLIPTLTVEENLLLPLELSGRVGRGERERARSLLDRVGLADRAGTYPDRLSGGEQQRVAVARALVHEPEIVLADEPTGNLDADTGRGVLALMDELVRGAGRTMLVVTHSPELVTLADRAFDLRQGRLEERSP